jgi:hypothetical protein
MRRRLFVAPLTVVMLATGCATTLIGSAKPAPSLTPRSLGGQTIDRVLLGDAALSRILKQPLNIDPRFPPRFGGPEALQDDGSTSPVDCLGVATMLQHSVYRSAKINNVALKTWRHAARSADVTSVKEGVVSLPTADDANALFANFSQQWQKCDGATQPLPGSVIRLKATITNLRITASVLAATISMGWASPRSDPASIPAARALGVRGNCLVEVEVDFFDATHPGGPGGADADVDATAVDIAQRIMDKVSALR